MSLSEAGRDKTAAEVTYTYTSLGPEGDNYLGDFTEEAYVQFMRDWEAELNHFLATGAQLSR